MFDVFSLPFLQRGVWEILLLAVGAGIIGTWIVLRGLAFYSHAVGTASFPGLVLADGLGFPVSLGAAATGLLVAAGVGALGRRGEGDQRHDAITAVVLCGALAAGVILASDVFASAASVETLLFGSLLVIDSPDLILAAVTSAVVLAASLILEPRWLATGFDPAGARSMGARSPLPDLLLLALVALVAVAVLSAVGALLATALLVVPAATTRLITSRLHTWQVATVLLVALEGVGGLWLSVQTNAPAGATIAVLGGAVFVIAVVVRVVGPRRRAAAGVAGAAALATLAAGCGGERPVAGADVIKVVATTTQVGDFARSVGGARVKVVQLLQPNSDPHAYEPRPQDIRDASAAALVFVSGDGIDDWADGVARQAGIDDALVDVGATRPVKLRRSGDRIDPHWWHDPRNARAAVEVIRERLTRADPAGRSVYEARATAYAARLTRLDHDVAACMRLIPRRERRLVSDHDAFAYLARRYGITMIGAVIPATTTQAQPSAGELSALARTIEEQQVRAIFPESSLNPKLAEAISRRTGARVGGRLYADTLGVSGTAAATYIGSSRSNADALVRGFSGGARGCGTSG